MKRILGLVVIILIVSCESEEETKFHYSDFHNLTIMDPYEGISNDENAQDTVFYLFGTNNAMTKIRFDYSETDGVAILEKKDTVTSLYYLENNSLIMTTAKLDETFNLEPIFGKDYAEWKVLTLNSDTMIVDAYSYGGQRLKAGHWGFSVQ